jgi:hypothetical protein
MSPWPFWVSHNLMVDPANCRLVQAGGRVFASTAVTRGPTASVITGASPLTSMPASAAVDVKLPSGLSADALNVAERPYLPHLFLLPFSRQASLQLWLPPMCGQPRRRRT